MQVMQYRQQQEGSIQVISHRMSESNIACSLFCFFFSVIFLSFFPFLPNFFLYPFGFPFFLISLLADHSPPSSAGAKNAWSYTSAPPFICVFLIKHRGNPAFILFPFLFHSQQWVLFHSILSFPYFYLSLISSVASFSYFLVSFTSGCYV
jgi:hypothetical protein